MKIKEKVMKELEKGASFRYPFDAFWSEIAIDKTLAEVGKVIDEFAKKDYNYFVKKTKLKLQPRGWKDWKVDREKLKEVLGIK